MSTTTPSSPPKAVTRRGDKIFSGLSVGSGVAILATLAAVAKSVAGLGGAVQVIGHTDDTGTAAYALDLEPGAAPGRQQMVDDHHGPRRRKLPPIKDTGGRRYRPRRLARAEGHVSATPQVGTGCGGQSTNHGET